MPLIIAIVALAALVIGFFLARMMGGSEPPPADTTSLTMLQNQLNAGLQQTNQQVETLRQTVNDSLQAMTAQMSKALTEANKTVGDRLDNTAKVIGDVRQQLGQLDESSKRMAEVGRDISKLQEILQPPKLRGSLGELFLGDLLAQVLPPDHYDLQYMFKGGEKVDAVVRLSAGLVPIDAKFPLENFKRILASAGEEERKAARKGFLNDVKSHIDDIASKYIRVDEDTFDFALMYIPAENVYYETIIKDDEFGGEMSLFTYALKRRVIPVSPNSFYAYLQTIILGLKGMRVEEKSREILENIARLHKEFEGFAESFRLVGQHLDNSQKKFDEAQKRFGKIETRVEMMDGLVKRLDAPETPAALPPPAG